MGDRLLIRNFSFALLHKQPLSVTASQVKEKFRKKELKKQLIRRCWFNGGKICFSEIKKKATDPVRKGKIICDPEFFAR